MFFGLTLKTYPQIHGNKSLYRCKTPVIQYMQNDFIFVCDFCLQSKYSQIWDQETWPYKTIDL